MTCGISPPPSAAPAPRRWRAYAVSSRLGGALPLPSRTPSPSSVTALLTAPFASMLTRRRFRALRVKTRFNGFLFQDCGRPRFRNWPAKSRNRCFDEPELPAPWTKAAFVGSYLADGLLAKFGLLAVGERHRIGRQTGSDVRRHVNVTVNSKHQSGRRTMINIAS